MFNDKIEMKDPLNEEKEKTFKKEKVRSIY